MFVCQYLFVLCYAVLWLRITRTGVLEIQELRPLLELTCDRPMSDDEFKRVTFLADRNADHVLNLEQK